MAQHPQAKVFKVRTSFFLELKGLKYDFHTFREFDEALKVIKWPFVNSNVSLEVPLEVNVKKLQIIVEYLLQIDLPDELVPPSEAKGYLSEFPRLSLPMELMIAPLRKRFLYHFHGSRKTNRSDKPEW